MSTTIVTQDRYTDFVIPFSAGTRESYVFTSQARKRYFLLSMLALTGILAVALIGWRFYLAHVLFPSATMQDVSTAVISALWLTASYVVSKYTVNRIDRKRAVVRRTLANQFRDALNNSEGRRYKVTAEEAERFLVEGEGYAKDYTNYPFGIRHIMTQAPTTESGMRLQFTLNDESEVLEDIQKREIAQRYLNAF